MTLLRRAFRDRYFRRGIWLLVLGTGPLVGILVAAAIGLTRDPNPNPIGPGLLAFFTFWPSILLMLVGLIRTTRQADTE